MPDISVVIPTLNAARSLKATLMRVRESATVREAIVSDGGSRDDTVAIAQGLGAVVVQGPPGRGLQLQRGASVATGPWLMFLHADTVLEPHWPQAVSAHITTNPAKAGYFRFTLDDDTPAARRLERAVAWRNRVLGLPYGDQGLFLPRGLYDAIGGFRDWTLMEDVDLVRRIGKRRLAALDCRAITSAERFLRDGYWRRSARNIFCLGLYYAGVNPRIIHRVYG